MAIPDAVGFSFRPSLSLPTGIVNGTVQYADRAWSTPLGYNQETILAAAIAAVPIVLFFFFGTFKRLMSAWRSGAFLSYLYTPPPPPDAPTYPSSSRRTYTPPPSPPPPQTKTCRASCAKRKAWACAKDPTFTPRSFGESSEETASPSSARCRNSQTHRSRKHGHFRPRGTSVWASVCHWIAPALATARRGAYRGERGVGI